MTYLLDTNSCIYYLNGSHPRIVDRVLELGPDRVWISSLTAAELYFGAESSARREANVDRVDRFLLEIPYLAFDLACSEEFGKIKDHLVNRGTPIPDFDIAIGATARVHRLTVVTNDRHLSWIEGLSVVNWTTA